MYRPRHILPMTFLAGGGGGRLRCPGPAWRGGGVKEGPGAGQGWGEVGAGYPVLVLVGEQGGVEWGWRGGGRGWDWGAPCLGPGQGIPPPCGRINKVKTLLSLVLRTRAVNIAHGIC